MITVEVIYNSGFSETHEFKSKKTITYTCPDGAKVRTIKITSK